MTWIDWAIVIVVVLSVLAGLSEGFFRSTCSLAGVVLGLALAAWNYAPLATLFLPLVRIEPVANAIAFLLIAGMVMAAAGILGAILAKAMHQIGLGCLDRLLGGAFGLFKGLIAVMICILVAVAFFPRAGWLVQSKLPRAFFGACHLSTHITPAELSERVRQGLRTLEEESPRWMHQKIPEA